MTTAMTVIFAAASPATAAAASAAAPAALFSSQTWLPSLSILKGGSRTRTTLKTRLICCDVALRSDSSTSIGDDPSSSTVLSAEEEEEMKSKLEKVGSRVRVKAPLKVYHVPRVPEVELTPEMEGVIKQYVGFWKGKRISANLPYKVEFVIHVQDRGPVKFFAHLKEDEFEFI